MGFPKTLQEFQATFPDEESCGEGCETYGGHRALFAPGANPERVVGSRPGASSSVAVAGTSAR